MGKKDPQVSYHDNGQLLEKGTHKNGKKYGPWVRQRTVIHSKEPTRRVRETVLGFHIIRMGLLTQNSQEPIRTVGRLNRPLRTECPINTRPTYPHLLRNRRTAHFTLFVPDNPPLQWWIITPAFSELSGLIVPHFLTKSDGRGFINQSTGE